MQQRSKTITGYAIHIQTHTLCSLQNPCLFCCPLIKTSQNICLYPYAFPFHRTPYHICVYSLLDLCLAGVTPIFDLNSNMASMQTWNYSTNRSCSPHKFLRLEMVRRYLGVGEGGETAPHNRDGTSVTDGTSVYTNQKYCYTTIQT